MRIIAILLSLTILNASAALFKKKNTSPEIIHETYLSEFTHIEKLYGSNSNQYPLRADLIIPAIGDSFQLMVHYDELTDMAIKDIIWISGRSSKPISPLSTESSINSQIEKLVNRSNPGLAYDRMQTGKHVITKTYYFKKSKVFPSKRAEPQKIKITWINNAVIYVPIENLYLGKSEPSATPKARPTIMTKVPNPRDSHGRMAAAAPEIENEQVRQEKQNEYEMLEIESTLRQMKQQEPSEEGVPALPEF